MKRIWNWLKGSKHTKLAKQHKTRKPVRRTPLGLETLETRSVMAADVLPVLMVIADQQDFYYQEYGDTRTSIEAAGLDVQVAATTTTPSFPHQNTGEGDSHGMAGDVQRRVLRLSRVGRVWTSQQSMSAHAELLSSGLPSGLALRWGETVHDDGSADGICGGAAADWLFAHVGDVWCVLEPQDRLTKV